jgi:hypothetical protein
MDFDNELELELLPDEDDDTLDPDSDEYPEDEMPADVRERLMADCIRAGQEAYKGVK